MPPKSKYNPQTWLWPLTILNRIEQNQETMMANEQDLQNALDGVKADLDQIQTAVSSAVTTEQEQAAQIASLQAQIAQLTANQPVTQQQLDNLTGEANTLKSQSDAVLAALTPVAPATPTP